MTFRQRLALMCLRVLHPAGISDRGIPLLLGFDTGHSTPDKPELVMRVRSADTGQVLLSMVIPPDLLMSVAEDFRATTDRLKTAGGR